MSRRQIVNSICSTQALDVRRSASADVLTALSSADTSSKKGISFFEADCSSHRLILLTDRGRQPILTQAGEGGHKRMGR